MPLAEGSLGRAIKWTALKDWPMKVRMVVLFWEGCSP